MLTELRTDVTDKLVAGGIKALVYTDENLTPSVAAVVPSEPYITRNPGETAFAEPITVRLDVLLLAPMVEARARAALIDQMIEDAMRALRPDFKTLEVHQPAEIELSGSSFMGAVLTIQHDTKEP